MDHDVTSQQEDHYLVAPPPTPIQPPFQHMMNNLVPVWVMSPYGPVLQWGYPQDMSQQPQPEPQKQSRAVTRMVPRQVAYKDHYTLQQRNQPRKRLNAPRVERREDTYARSNVTIDDNSDSEKEEGEC